MSGNCGASCEGQTSRPWPYLALSGNFSHHPGKLIEQNGIHAVCKTSISRSSIRQTREMPKPPSTSTGHDPQKHGNWAQWAAVSVAVLIGLCNAGLTVHYHHEDSSATASDEHSNTLINAKLAPAVNEINK